jgi:hypothetical protein
MMAAVAAVALDLGMLVVSLKWFLYRFAATFDGASLDDCIAEMGRRWGSPQASVETIAPEVIQATAHRVPSVWFLERLERVDQQSNFPDSRWAGPPREVKAVK